MVRVISKSVKPGASAWLVVVATAAAYTVTGWLALLLAVPPSYASPLFPSAGIALAATFVYGRSALPGVWLGNLLVNVSLASVRVPDTPMEWLLPSITGFGAALQAGLGAWLVRRYVGKTLLMADPREIARAGLLGAVVACMVSASIATVALRWQGVLRTSDMPANWLTWWVGDALGALIGGPLTLVWIGRPRREWAPRRRTVGLPLLLSTVLLGAASMLVTRWDEDRLAAAFDRDAERLYDEAEGRLGKSLHALEGLHSAWLAAGGLDAQQLHAAAQWWLAAPLELQAMGFSERVPRADLARFEARVRATGLADYRVFDRQNMGPAGEDLVAMRLVEPLAGNAAALGVNVLSIPAARAAVAHARDTGRATASAGFRLTQSVNDETGLVLYQGVYRSPPENVQQRQADFAGVLFVTVRAERLLAGLGGPEKGHLQWCLLDLEPEVQRVRLAGDPACEQRPGVGFERQRTLNFAGRQLAMRVRADPALMPGGRDSNAWLFSVAGMLAAAMLGALLLTVTGRARRIELAVDERTAALRREVQERTQAQGALRQSEARLRNILDHVPTGVVFLDPPGRIVETNPHLCEMLGRQANELLDHPLTDSMAAEDHGAYTTALASLLDGRQETTDLQIRLHRADGQTVAVRARFSVLFDSSGHPLWVAGVAEDISEHLRLQASERALDRAEAANRAKSEFVSRMSHELRTPLNAMIGFAQLLALDREPPLSAHQRDWAGEIQRAGWHLLDMINDTLDLARIESGAVQLRPHALDLREVLAACNALLSHAAAQRHISFHHEVPDDACAVLADETRLKQVLTNLLSNAVKYNREHGEVRVTVCRRGLHSVAITIRDTGLGMTAEQQAALFQPYNRLGHEHGQIEGTGIGLVISRRLAELMGGTLSVESQAELGSAFTLTLPRSLQALPVATHASPSPVAIHLQRHVHYIEDNETNVEVMRGMLTQRPQVRLTVSVNGLDGLAALRRDRPDLLLLDMQLPDISGLELLRNVKGDDDLAGLPVIVVSADATTATMQEALTLGASQYVTKPVDLQRFLATLDATLDATDAHWG